MAFPLTPPIQAGEILPLSISQRDIWLDQMAWPESVHLNIGGGAFLEGPLDRLKFRTALQHLVNETEALRIVPLANGTQYLVDNHPADLAEIDLSHETDPRQAIQAWWNEQIKLPFADKCSPPWRFTLLKAGPECHGLTIQFHHSIMDGWGTTQIMRRWSEIFNAADRAEVPPARPLPYRQYISESNGYVRSPAYEKDRSYWQDNLPAIPHPLIEARQDIGQIHLPLAHLHHQTIPRNEYDQLVRFAAQNGCTPFAVILSAIAIYFSRSRRQSPVVIGVPTLNRGGNRYLGTPGMFVGVMPIPITVEPAASIATILQATHRSLREALRHARYPLSETSSRLKLLRENRSHLFDVLLSFERQDYGIEFGPARLVQSRQLFSGIARYPLGVTVCEFSAGQDLEMILEGNSGCYSAAEVELLSRRFWTLVNGLVANPQRTIADLDIVPEEERRSLLDGLHQCVRQHDERNTFVGRFVDQAKLHPHAVSLVWPGGAMSYGELGQRSANLALFLSQYVKQKDSIVALAMDRSPQMIVAILATLRAGAAFLPLDPEAPVERLKKLLHASSAKAVLTQSCHLSRLAAIHSRIFAFDSLELPNLAVDADALPEPAGEDLACVLYTSGSSGEPKGVMVEHGALTRRLLWLSATYQVESSDRSAQATQYTFDPSLIEIFLPLMHGASVGLPPPGRLSADVLADFVITHGITIMAFVPSTLERFLDALEAIDRPDIKLRVACCGGEILPAELANRFLITTGARLFNVYGPTEAIIFATAWPCHASQSGNPLPVGLCVDNSRIYVLDEQQRLLPFGERGEIHIGGNCLARGYLNAPALSKQAFLPDPFLPGQSMYRTGDAGWLDCDGKLYFSGRLDRQIKLRGYRIELGEIEAALQSGEGVSRAAVQLVEHNGQPALHAWVASRANLDNQVLRDRLSRLLPDYMIPASFNLVSDMIETSSGKIDYAALPPPVYALTSHPARAPLAGLESELVTIWSQTLGKANIQVRDNFFELGGDSLALIDIGARLEKLLGHRIPLHIITENPTIERLTVALETSDSINPSLLKLAGEPGKPRLFLVASGHGDLIRFNALATLLEQTCEVFMLQPPEEVDGMSLDELTGHYAKHIAAQTFGPFFLAGFSVGGISGLETARRLIADEQKVAGVILIDTLYPHPSLRARKLWQTAEWLIAKLHIQELSMNGRHLGALFSDAGLVMQVKALADYRPAPYPGRVLLIRSSGLVSWQRWLFKPWKKMMTGTLSEANTPGLHGSIFETGNLEVLATIIRQQVNDPEHGARSDSKA